MENAFFRLYVQRPEKKMEIFVNPNTRIYLYTTVVCFFHLTRLSLEHITSRVERLQQVATGPGQTRSVVPHFGS